MFEAFYSFDLALAEFGNSMLKAAGAFFTPVFRAITFCGELGWAFIVAGLVLLCFRRTRRTGAATLIALLLAAVFVNLIIKNAVARPRPFHDESSPFYGFWVQAGSVKVGEYSFPSGHSTVSMAFAVVLVFALNKKYSWLFLLLPLVMGLTRIYFGVHFASDVLFGYIIGAACGVGGWFLTKLLTKWKLFKRFLEADGLIPILKRRFGKTPAAAEESQTAEPQSAEPQSTEEENDE